MKFEIDLLNLNYYLFNKIEFYNKIIYDKIFFFKKNKKLIEFYYLKLKSSFLTFSPFYGIDIDNYFINNYLSKNKKYINLKKKKYKIPYLDLSYIFNFSIEKIRIKKNV